MTRVRNVSANQRAEGCHTDQWEACKLTLPWCILIMILGTSTLCILAKQERMNNKVIRGNVSSCILDRRTEEIHCCSPEHFKLFKQTFSDFRFAENSRQPWFASLEKFITDTFLAIFLRILLDFAKYCQAQVPVPKNKNPVRLVSTPGQLFLCRCWRIVLSQYGVF